MAEMSALSSTPALSRLASYGFSTDYRGPTPLLIDMQILYTT